MKAHAVATIIEVLFSKTLSPQQARQLAPLFTAFNQGLVCTVAPVVCGCGVQRCASHACLPILPLRQFALPVRLPFGLSAFGRAMQARKAIIDLVSKSMDATSGTKEGGEAAAGAGGVGNANQDLVQLLKDVVLETGDAMPQHEILDNVLLLVFAGHDTTSHTYEATLECPSDCALTNTTSDSVVLLLLFVVHHTPPQHVQHSAAACQQSECVTQDAR